MTSMEMIGKTQMNLKKPDNIRVNQQITGNRVTPVLNMKGTFQISLNQCSEDRRMQEEAGRLNTEVRIILQNFILI